MWLEEYLFLYLYKFHYPARIRRRYGKGHIQVAQLLFRDVSFLYQLFDRRNFTNAIVSQRKYKTLSRFKYYCLCKEQYVIVR